MSYFSDGAGAVLATDLGNHSIARAVIPVLSDSELESALDRAVWNHVQNNFLEAHFAGQLRHALSSSVLAIAAGDGMTGHNQRRSPLT